MSKHDLEITSAPKDGDTTVIAPKDAALAQGRSDEAKAAKITVDQIIQLYPARVGELPKLLAKLAPEDAYQFSTTVFPALGSYTRGDVMIDIAETLGLTLGWSLPYVAQASAKPTQTALHRFITRHYAQLTDVDDDTFTALRAVGGKLTELIPTMLVQMADFAGRPVVLAWFVETTPAGIVANTFAQVVGSTTTAETLATTLDGLDSKDAFTWIDHLAGAQGSPGFAALAAKLTAHDAAKQKLVAMMGPIGGSDEAAISRYRKAHEGDVDATLAGKPTVKAIVDAVAARGSVMDERQADEILVRLHALDASADEVYAVCQLIGASYIAKLRALLTARGVTAQHLEQFVLTGLGPRIFDGDAKLLQAFRDKAPGVRAQDLFAVSGSADHELLVSNPGLAAWYLENATPHDLLWFAAGGDLASRTCAMLDKRDPSWRWVFELSSAAPADQLRLLALNCPNAKVVDHVRTVLLPEKPATGERVDRPAAPDARIAGGELGRLGDALAQKSPVLLERIADLTPAEAVRVGGMDKYVAQIAEQLSARDFARGATLLDLPFARTIEFARLPTPALIEHLRLRPAGEEAAAVARPELVARVPEHVHPEVLLVFPSLADPAALAPVLTGKLLELLLAHSDPNQVAQAISRPPALAVAERIFGTHPELLDRLPNHRQMTHGGQIAVDDLAKAAKGDTKATLDDVRHDRAEPETDVVEESTRLHAADRLPLAQGLAKLLDDGGSATSVIALFREHRDQLAAVLADPAHAKLFERVSATLKISPVLALPELSLQAILGMANARIWLFDAEQPIALLDQLVTNRAALAHVSQLLAGNDLDAGRWLFNLPQGPALTDAELLALDRMQANAGWPVIVLRVLFAVRFAIEAPEHYDAATLVTLYHTLSRLPRAHLQQGRIKHIIDVPLPSGHAGEWSGEDIKLEDTLKPGGEKDVFHPDDNRMSRAHLRRLYGWSDAEIELQVHRGNIKHLAEADQFVMVTAKPDKFETTVIHEVGHAVDNMLGNQTEPVYGGEASWHAFAEADFDGWAAEMGGWDKVSASDKVKIAEVWLAALRGGKSVQSLVGPDHPALDVRYGDNGVGIVRAALDNKSFDHSQPVIIGDRAFIKQPYYSRFYSVSASAVASRPSIYSLYAPQEYFAECYVEYYRQVDGTPGSAAKKGGALPATVKTWFDQHVDTLRYDPKRFDD